MVVGDDVSLGVVDDAGSGASRRGGSLRLDGDDRRRDGGGHGAPVRPVAGRGGYGADGAAVHVGGGGGAQQRGAQVEDGSQGHRDRQDHCGDEGDPARAFLRDDDGRGGARLRGGVARVGGPDGRKVRIRPSCGCAGSVGGWERGCGGGHLPRGVASATVDLSRGVVVTWDPGGWLLDLVGMRPILAGRVRVRGGERPLLVAGRFGATLRVGVVEWLLRLCHGSLVVSLWLSELQYGRLPQRRTGNALGVS